MEREQPTTRKNARRGYHLTRRLTLPAFLILLIVIGSLSKLSSLSATEPRPLPATKLIALTFDDGPKPYVLLGTKSANGVRSESLLGLLRQQRIKATFFVMGWRLSKNADAWCCRVDGGICRDAAEQEHRDGDEIENHTYGHGDFRLMEKRYGDAWILADIDRASRAIESITGVRPEFVRPPDWDIWPALAAKMEARGYRMMTKAKSVPPQLRDLDSEDYFCAGKDLSKCPKPSDYDYVLQRIGQRERQGIDDDILAFHELAQTVQMLTRLIPSLKAHGYHFVLLRDYMASVSGNHTGLKAHATSR